MLGQIYCTFPMGKPLIMFLHLMNGQPISNPYFKLRPPIPTQEYSVLLCALYDVICACYDVTILMMSLCMLKDLTLIGTGVTMVSISHLLHCHGDR